MFEFWRSVWTWLGTKWTVMSGGGASPVNSANSASGKTVSPDTALALSTVWACVKLLSQSVATLPFNVYKREDNRRQLAPESDLWTLLHDRPNETMTASDFWMAWVCSLLLWGNAYALIRRVGGRVVALDLLRPEYMVPQRNDAGRLVYRYSAPGLEPKEYAPKDVLHVKWFTVDGLIGLSPIRYGANTMGLAMAQDEAAGKLFASGLRVSGVFKTKEWLKPGQRDELRGHLQAFAGTAGEKAGSFMVLEGGQEFDSITMNPADAELLSSRSWSVEDICRWYGVPPWMVGHTDKGSNWGTGLEQQMIGFLTFALAPILGQTEKVVNMRLVAPEQAGRLYAKFNIEGLLRADSAGRAALYSAGAQNGWLTRNEIRGLEDREPMPGGDQLTVQSNLLPIEMLGKPMPQPIVANAQRDADLATLERGQVELRQALIALAGLVDKREPIAPPTINVHSAPVNIQPPTVHVTLPEIHLENHHAQPRKPQRIARDADGSYRVTFDDGAPYSGRA